MRMERAGTASKAVDSPEELRAPVVQDPITGALPLQLRISQRPPANRVEQLRNLADKLLQETETLARDKAFADESSRLQALNLADGIDFYDEVQRFETGLIKLALDQTRGHQARAARLLRIKPTTLNSKIKLYGIEY
ncbi:MAG TPA: helix-turn-helix domain-containing protein [Pyrinomonadaceae bacterium]|nr:helix-turn-helix domain-containing protein [Pyrinomonadaceae bacterium]